MEAHARQGLLGTTTASDDSAVVPGFKPGLMMSCTAAQPMADHPWPQECACTALQQRLRWTLHIYCSAGGKLWLSNALSVQHAYAGLYHCKAMAQYIVGKYKGHTTEQAYDWQCMARKTARLHSCCAKGPRSTGQDCRPAHLGVFKIVCIMSMTSEAHLNG